MVLGVGGFQPGIVPEDALELCVINSRYLKKEKRQYDITQIFNVSLYFKLSNFN